MRTGRRKRTRNIAVITGTRADYGLLHPVMTAVARRSSLRLHVVATGMHLLKKFGHTIDAVRHDGWKIDARIKMQTGDDSKLDQAAGLARGVAGIAKFLDQAKIDIVVVLGDRIEAMAGALASVTTGRALAHIHGGDVAPGDFDESLRHAITKLAHIHLAATREAQRRIIRMGECKTNVHFVGAPGLDGLAARAAKRSKSRDGTGRILILQHPSGRSVDHEKRVMNAVLRAVKGTNRAHTIVYPNSDRGHAGIIAAIESHGRDRAHGNVRIERCLPRDDFLDCLINADVLIGNSSSGIIEAATAGTHCVNIGPRQAGRQRSSRSVIDTNESFSSIQKALRSALGKPPITRKPTAYGDGRAGVKIAAILASAPPISTLVHKRNAY